MTVPRMGAYTLSVVDRSINFFDNRLHGLHSQPIQLFRPLGHWADKPLSVHCSTGLGYTLILQDIDLS